MRLIDTKTKRMVDKVGPPPRYAILSHTWGEEEVTFQDIVSGIEASRKGYRKFQGAIKLAASEGYEFIWIDNCCIDKSSSAELSEAINSMFKWYRQATICYAYLSDIATLEDLDIDGRVSGMSLDEGSMERLSSSRWFHRSWTLQELIAPQKLDFYSSQWQWLGSKHDNRWTDMLSRITRISQDALTTSDGYRNASVAQKMSWAADREATREEDVAYALFGLFDVNMAPLYGEGGRSALRRLQEEIIRRSFDDSILAWDPLNLPPSLSGHRQAALAPTPSCFRETGDVIYVLTSRVFEAEPMTITPRGLLVDLPVVKIAGTNDVIAVLSSRRVGDLEGLLGLRLCPVMTSMYDGIDMGSTFSYSASFFTRDGASNVISDLQSIQTEALTTEGMKSLSRKITIVSDDGMLTHRQQPGPHSRPTWIESLPQDFRLAEVHPRELFVPDLRAFRPGYGTLRQPRRHVLLLFGVIPDVGRELLSGRIQSIVVVISASCDDKQDNVKVSIHRTVQGEGRVVFRKIVEEQQHVEMLLEDPQLTTDCGFSHYPDQSWLTRCASSTLHVHHVPMRVEVRPKHRGGQLGMAVNVATYFEIDGLERTVLNRDETDDISEHLSADDTGYDTKQTRSLGRRALHKLQSMLYSKGLDTSGLEIE